ncbi:oxalate decarboxylase [Physcia stellaris]|nr:oxalate decarboxylase [Physcia stellaris]
MKSTILLLLSSILIVSITTATNIKSTEAPKHLRPILSRRQSFSQGDPINSKGAGAPISGGTNPALDQQNPDNLGAQSTDSGTVPNLKWSFSDSRTRLFAGGWVREQVEGALREMHWHRVAEWGFVYNGSVRIAVVDDGGENQVDVLGVGDIWYIPKGQAHTFQGSTVRSRIFGRVADQLGLEDQNEVLLAFDDGDFDATGTTFNVDDWIAHTPKSVLAKNFGVNESIFDTVPTPDPYIVKANVSQENVTSPYGKLEGNSSYVYHLSKKPVSRAPGGGGTVAIVDSRNFPVATTIAAAVVTLEPHGLRELHWHPNAEEWLYFHRGEARATVFLGGATARTFDFRAGDTAVFPDNSGHYIENTSDTEKLVWIELYKSDRVVDVSLTQWLALTPADIVASTLKIPFRWLCG